MCYAKVPAVIGSSILVQKRRLLMPDAWRSLAPETLFGEKPLAPNCLSLKTVRAVYTQSEELNQARPYNGTVPEKCPNSEQPFTQRTLVLEFQVRNIADKRM